MKVNNGKWLAVAGLAAAYLAATVSAFSPSASVGHVVPRGRKTPTLALSSSSTPDSPCECGNAAIISGTPSPKARLVNPKEALSKSTVRRLDGSPVSVSDLLGNGDDDGVSLVVLTRSFGWPFCQEQILQYSSARGELLGNGVRFALISIGKPESGLELCDHLGIEDGGEWIFADPENYAYDRLELNRGWDTMMSPATAFRFRDRIFGGKGASEFKQLFEVLGKWKDAVYVPPKLDQSTNHGGTFIFKGEDVVFAHYDESPGKHADTFDVVDRAIREATKQ